MSTLPPAAQPAASPPHDRPGLGARSDAMLRGLFVLVGIYYPVMATEAGLRLGADLDPLVPVLSALQALLCLLCLLGQRHGHTVRAATGFVLGQLVLLSAAYGYWGLAAQLKVQLVQLLPVLLVAAVLGVRPLWWASSGLCGVVVIGAWTDAAGSLFRDERVLQAATDLCVAGFGIVLVAWLLQQSVTGLRESLRQSRQHSQELASKRDQLQVEIQERERSRDQLVHAMKMENVGRLASGIAHDFNHLLGLVHGYAGKARRSASNEELQQALQGVDSAARRASAVSRRLLDFSRLEASRPQLFDAADAVAAMAPMLQQVFDAGVECQVDTGGVRCRIHFDPAQLESILLSLAVNAHQAMPEGGRFQLRLEHRADRAELCIRAGDSGQGMSEEVRARCLEPFFTTKPMGQGTGLGLAVTASLVAAAGGHIQVDSRAGHGTEVEIRLPARPTVPTPA